MPFPNADSLWADVLAVRQQQPLVHNITNFVVMNYNANALLALGAAPVMAHAREEVRDMAGIAQALVLNIGTLSPEWIEAMVMALQTARGRGIPVVLDPVGAGATPYRNRAVAELLAAGSPTVLRGNASEILSVAGVEAATRGVDSAAASDDAVQTARTLAARLGAVVCVSGATDHILAPDGRHVRLSNGHVWMTRVTGVGCSATALIGAFCAVQPDAFHATIAAMAYLGVVGEVAAAQVQAQGRGVGQLQIALLDGLQLLDAETFHARLRLQTDD
ncbi:hydoxyethylthiazole kinase [Thiomonas arsenitoxydans]|uniref:Hydroxyethylthiazole kinase n=1 Tax=Thiomonas arsenitoxydans (strain DSM 22701 / CIP 110005 / 3As) TaxID=426114 RepID=D6CLD2_THIA3|nr:hydroxyethylthiazole kinase [Thiomonas arsenitoxydans]CQR45535.1 hydoxyethylthiazole kinase [Thiomonas sp. CB3]CAZ89360.1 Hydroxyethylthiazole kinase (4-methyl-5-beta-hydroxyethylthiazole kinase) (Thz kinase) (TH kinase) [Thiomonas arsenitoxydans]CQR33842.1 hydoxyethylthiazole kinase [Thiomonas arsenitoxydans]CQR35569.1 hydoxyethylthiazole kinase [Thiomonas arsenitoxydans]CQR37802.1 hydoxyethylthiazole kinase [Thiomonas arsenitoxydans]